MEIKPFVYDIEVFPNYFLMVLYRDGKYWEYEDPNEVSKLLDRSANIVLAGFNNRAYDDIILQSIWQGNTTLDSIYDLSSKLISGENWEDVTRIKFSKKPWAFSIDMFQLLEKKAGLKEWQCHTHFRDVKESPVSFTAPLPSNRVQEIKDYCKNDVAATENLLRLNWDKIELRAKLQEKFGVSNKIYAMGSARTAEEIFIFDYARRTGKPFSEITAECKLHEDNVRDKYTGQELMLPCVNYTSDEFNGFKEMFATATLVRQMGETAWDIVSEHDGKRHIRGANERDVAVSCFKNLVLANRTFTMGVGGLHTQDNPGEFYGDEQYQIIDADVTSYYPSLMIEHNLLPKHVPTMHGLMVQIKESRVQVKRELKTIDIELATLESSLTK